MVTEGQDWDNQWDLSKGSQQEAHFVSKPLNTNRRNDASVTRVMFPSEISYGVRERAQTWGSEAPARFSSQLETVLQKPKLLLSLDFQ